MRNTAFIAALALSGALGSAANAEVYEVQRMLQLPNTATEVWHMVGDFCDIDDWHPAVATCALRVEDGGLFRVLTTTDGAEFEERRIASEQGLSYTYRITESPLPVERYTATFSIESLDGALLSWSARFQSDDPAMEAVITEIFDTGLAAIAAAFAAD